MFQWIGRSFLTFIFLFGFFQVQAGDLPDFTSLVKQAAPTVVNISTITHQNKTRNFHGNPNTQQLPDIFKHFFGAPVPRGPQREQSSLGSGFIVSKDGYILTNHHVVKGADEIIVRLTDRRELMAELIGEDPRSDLALLKVDADDLPVVDIGDSDKLEVGEWVVAIGSPFGFDYSVTKGIVSAKGRSLPSENYVPFIQTDVAINPGNSGGPLFDLDGRVVGINSQIYTRSGGFMGLSFAIPINVAMDVVAQLKDKGLVSRGWLGVVIQEVNKDLAESFGLDKAAGALVAQLAEGGPAQAAGLEPGDIITQYNDKKINLSSDLPHLVGRTKPGESAEVEIVRNGKRKTLDVEIGVLPEEDVVLAGKPRSSLKQNVLGIVVADLTRQQINKIGVEGVLVKEVGPGPAAAAGLVSGDVITLLNGQRIINISDFKRVLKSLPEGRLLPLRILRRGVAMFIPLRIPRS